jgi:hypothetical protein
MILTVAMLSVTLLSVTFDIVRVSVFMLIVMAPYCYRECRVQLTSSLRKLVLLTV